MLDVTVSDNGAGMTEEMIARVMAGRADQNEEDRFSTGIAVRNVIDRLQLYYKEENLFTIETILLCFLLQDGIIKCTV